MRIDPIATIADGLRRPLSTAVLPVAAIFCVSYLVAAYGTIATVVVGLLAALASRRWWVVVGLCALIAALWLAAAVATLYAHVLTARVLGPAVATDRGPYTRRIGRAMASTIAIAVLGAPFAIGGTMLAVLPGLAVFTIGGLAVVTVAIEDRPAFDAIRRATALASAAPGATALVGALLGVAMVVGLLGSLIAVGIPIVGGVLRAVLLTILQVAVLGVLVETVCRIRAVVDIEVSA